MKKIAIKYSSGVAPMQFLTDQYTGAPVVLSVRDDAEPFEIVKILKSKGKTLNAMRYKFVDVEEK